MKGPFIPHEVHIDGPVLPQKDLVSPGKALHTSNQAPQANAHWSGMPPSSESGLFALAFLLFFFFFFFLLAFFFVFPSSRRMLRLGKLKPGGQQNAPECPKNTSFETLNDCCELGVPPLGQGPPAWSHGVLGWRSGSRLLQRRTRLGGKQSAPQTEQV